MKSYHFEPANKEAKRETIQSHKRERYSLQSNNDRSKLKSNKIETVRIWEYGQLKGVKNMKRFFILMLMIFAMFSCTEVSEDTGNNDNYNDNYSDNTTNDNTNTDNNTNNDNYNDNYNDNNTNTSYTVYFYAGEVNWDEVYVYSWDDYNKNEAWPGERMSSDGNGWYSATVNYPKIIFNGGNGGPQTGDLKSQDGYFVPENSGSSISGT